MTGKLGRRPPHPRDTHPRLALGPFLHTDRLPPTPPVVDWMSRIEDWPMYGNQDWGDCVWAMVGHAIEAYTTYGQGSTVTVTDADVLRGYSDVTGFDPTAGPPGNNPTDRGTIIQDALGYWRKVGVGGHKILAFAEVNHRNPDEVDAALWLFGHLMLGINFPASAMRQFDQGAPWESVPDDGGIEGGHAVNLGAESPQAPHLAVVTWGQVQGMTPAFWLRYIEEAWIAIAPEWITAAGTDPAGVDLAAMGSAFTRLTGEPSPFPAPVPSPTPDADPVDLALANALRAHDWVTSHHVGTTGHVARAARDWLAARGL